MKIGIKRYIATFKIIDGDKVYTRDMEIVGQRIRPQTVKKQIPENSVLIGGRYETKFYNVDKDKLEKFLIENERRKLNERNIQKPGVY